MDRNNLLSAGHINTCPCKWALAFKGTSRFARQAACVVVGVAAALLSSTAVFAQGDLDDFIRDARIDGNNQPCDHDHSHGHVGGSTGFAALEGTRDFFATWDLFATTYICGLIIAATLGLVGVAVVARQQVFHGVAVSQAATCGVAAALCVGPWVGFATQTPDWLQSGVAILASLATAIAIGRSGRRQHEWDAWVFIVCGGLVVILVAHSPFGMDDVQRLMSSTLIGATSHDVACAAVLLGVLLTAVYGWCDRIVLTLLDPSTAMVLRLRPKVVNVGISVALGIAVGLAIKIAGLVFSVAALVLPALAAKACSRTTRTVLWMAPSLAAGGTAAAFVIGHYADWPPGPVVAVTLGLIAAMMGVMGAARG